MALLRPAHHHNPQPEPARLRPVHLYYQAPAYYVPQPVDGPAVFLCGGIIGCEDWQSYARDVLQHAAEPLTVLNPRRDDFPHDDPDACRIQFGWEQHHLHIPRVFRLFWFPKSKVDQAGAFAELVQALVEDGPVAVGCHSRYPRATMVRLWCQTLRPGLTVHGHLDHVLKDTLTQLHTFSLHSAG